MRQRVRSRKKIHAKFRKPQKLEPVDMGYSYILWVWETNYKAGWTHFLSVLQAVDNPLYETLIERYDKTFKAVRVCSEFFNTDFKRMFETENWVYFDK